jgi:drug/metabolite transporter (DMT)-like permease
LNFTGLTLISASTYQILKMLCLVFIAILSIIIFKRRYLISQWLAMLAVIFGLSIVSFQSISSVGDESLSGSLSLAEKNAKHHQVIVGVTLMICGQFLHASQAVIEEHILKNAGGQEPFFMMGWEGVWGLFLTSILLLPAQTFKCPFDESQCINGHTDDLTIARR